MSKLIIESAIFQEAKIDKIDDKKNKAYFRCIIQTADEKNRNKRIYPRQVLEQGMADCRERMKIRAFLNELDHPIPSGNRQFDAIRQTSVLLEEVCHLIIDYQFDNNLLYAEMETTSTPKGYLLYGLLKDNSGIGFSMRGMGDVRITDNTQIVRGPLTIISYDAVSRPSHKAAVVDFNKMKFESTMLTESNNLICCGDQCYLPNYFDKLVESHIITFFDKWV